MDLPNYEEVIISPSHHKYAVVIFAINEGEKLKKQLQSMSHFCKDVDVILADGGSNDGSNDIPFLKSQNVTALLIKKGPPGLSEQMRMGLGWCMKKGYMGCIVIDGNGKDDPKSIPVFLEYLRNGYDHIQGSRYIKGGLALNTPFLRYWGVRLLHAPLISVSSGYHYTDTTNGFRAYSKNFLLDERVKPFRNIFKKYELHYYLAIRAAKIGFKVAEIPVTRSYPEKGKIPTKISFFKGNWLILKTLLKCVFHSYNP